MRFKINSFGHKLLNWKSPKSGYKTRFDDSKRDNY